MSKGDASGAPWDAYPDGFMLRSALEDEAIEKLEVKSEVEAMPAEDARPAMPEPSKESGVGGMLKGLFGS